MMNRKNSKHEKERISMDQSVISEDSSSDEIKYTMKQRLLKLFMITEKSDNPLAPKLIEINDAMYENFCRTGSRKSSYINDIFRLYTDQDITIPKFKLALFSQYLVSIPDISTEEGLKITQYIKTLRFIMAGLRPIMNIIKPIVADAKLYGAKKVRNENVDTFNTAYSMEDEKEKEHTYARQHLHDAMSQKLYTHDWFLQQQSIVSDSINGNDYQDLMVFALLGFHYFNKKSEVYDSFLPEQLETQKISFKLSGFRPTTLSLGTFLKVIEHIDFKRHLFSV